MAQGVQNLLAMPKTQVWSLGWEDPLEEGKEILSSILAWRIPWTEEPGRATVHRVTRSWTWQLTEHTHSTSLWEWGSFITWPSNVSRQAGVLSVGRSKWSILQQATYLHLIFSLFSCSIYLPHLISSHRKYHVYYVLLHHLLWLWFPPWDPPRHSLGEW